MRGRLRRPFSLGYCMKHATRLKKAVRQALVRSACEVSWGTASERLRSIRSSLRAHLRPNNGVLPRDVDYEVLGALVLEHDAELARVRCGLSPTVLR